MALVNRQNPSEFESVEAQQLGETSLEDRFRFDIGDHVLRDPEFQQGFVVDILRMPSVTMAGTRLPRRVKVREFRVVDPYVAADIEGYEIVREYVEGLEAEIEHEGFNPLEERQKERPYHREGDPEPTTKEEKRFNKFTRAWLQDERVQALKAWHSNVPHAKALGYLTNPFSTGIIVDKKGIPVPTTFETAAHLRFVDDAVAIRDRAVAMQLVAEEHLLGRTSDSDGVMRWLSLASGTAEPSIMASQKTTDKTGTQINLTVVDYDPTALEYVERNAQNYGFQGEIMALQQDILAADYPEKIRDALGVVGEEGFDIVENMGFEEYLPQAGDDIGAFRDMGFLPQASDFTANAWSLVKPGGVLISGNMVVDRPQSSFVFGVVGWPIINARSEESILRVYKEAGILDDPRAKVELVRVRNDMTNSHLYDIVKVTKLEKPLVSSRLRSSLARIGLSSLR